MYDGLVALESTYLGVPTISCAQSRYSSATFAFMPSGRDQYLEILAKSDTKILFSDFLDTQKTDSLYNFTYWYVKTLVFAFPLVSFTDDIDDITLADINFISKFDVNPVLSRILVGEKDHESPVNVC